jgi:hypothetical protein
MIRILLAITILFSIRQGVLAQYTWKAGVSGGAVFSSAQSKEKDNVFRYKNRVGLTLGAYADFKMPVNNIYIQPGIFYTEKGGVISDPEINLNTDVLFRYLEIPAWLLYRKKAGGVHFFAGAGPIVGLGLSGREKSEEDVPEQEVSFGSNIETDDYKKLDFSGGLTAGVEFQDAATLSLVYTRTLNNLSLDENISFRNQYVGVRIGVYMYKKKSIKKKKK